MHMLDFYKLTPEDFENLCYEYICALYEQSKRYSVKHTRYVHDGGRDIEITFYDELSHFKIWAECKQHKRSIGLDDIGKNVVLVISKHVNKVIFFSASEITESAKIEISHIADKLNFGVSFLCGQRLAYELSTHPALIKKYFGADTVLPEAKVQDLSIICSVSEFESDAILPIQAGCTSISLKNGEFFNIYVHISNCTEKSLHNISVRTISIPFAVKILNTEETHEYLTRQSDCVVRFRGEIISKQNTTIELPDITVCYDDGSKTRKQKTIQLPCLDISKCKHYPFIGKEVTEFLAHEVRDAMEWCEQRHPQIFDLRGISGSGKSRLAEEIQKMAARQGLRTVYMNSAEYIDFDLIRKLLCELLHLPYYRGKINFEQSDIVELVKAQGGSETFASKIAKFMEYGKWGKSDTYYMVESVAHFLLEPFRETGYCMTIDNSQGLHPEIMKFLMRLADILSQNHGRVILIIVGNIERKPLFSQRNFQLFLNYLTEKKQTNNHSFTSYTCKAFSKEDAMLLFMHLFKIKGQNDLLLEKLLQKSGRLPFEVVMTLEYLSDMGIIEWQNAGEWRICDREKFMSFMTAGLETDTSILSKREAAWRRTHTKLENQKFEEILASVVCFEGLLPYTFISAHNMDRDLLDHLEQLLWLAPSPSGQGLQFFHDSILEFCRTQPRYRKNTKILKRSLNWLRTQPDVGVPHRQRIEFSCLYHLDRFQESFAYGLQLLTTHIDMLTHTDVVYIGQTLYEDSRVKKETANYITLASIYANAVFSLDNKELGCSVYADIIERIKNGDSPIGLDASCKILHRAINSQLQSARYDTALEWIGLLAAMPGLPAEYAFIAKNRYGVAYIALGRFDDAKKYLDEAMLLAKSTMKNYYWTSTAHSDLALYYFYNWRLFGRERTLSAIIHELETAVSDYQVFGKTDASRDIEMAWHKAFIHILNEKYSSAVSDSEKCISLSQIHHEAYGLSRGYNLKALAALQSGDTEAAKGYLEEGLHACEIYAFPSGVFRMYNNLGVILCQKGDYKKAGETFYMAINRLEQKIEYKQAPAAINLLMVSMCLKDKVLRNKASKLCDAIALDKVQEYRQSLTPDAVRSGTAESFSFFGFSGFSYIF